MANFSFTTGREPSLLPNAITAGTNAPSAGDVEVRISDTNGITSEEVKLALERIWYFYQTSILTTHSGV